MTRKPLPAKYFLTLCIFSLTVAVAYPQSESSCQNSAITFSEQFINLLENNNLEEAQSILDQWEQACGMNEPVYRAKALLRIQNSIFPGDISREIILDQAIAWEIRYQLMNLEDRELQQDYFETHASFFGYLPFFSTFDQKTLRLSRQWIRSHPEGTLSHAKLDLYGGEPQNFFNGLRKGSIDDQELLVVYDQKVDQFKKLPEFNMGLSSGIWIPSSGLSNVGLKPSLGVLLGVRWERISLNGLFHVRFGRSENPIEIALQDTITSTRTYQGGFGGVEFSWDVYARGSNKAGIYIAGGFDLIELVDKGQDDSKKSLFSPAFMAGFYYGREIYDRMILKVQPAWSILNHNNPQGTSLKGNALLLNIVLSFSDNARKTENLKRLGH